MGTGVAVAVFLLMVVGVGATGILNFNQIFKNRMQISDEFVGSELMGTAEAYMLEMPDSEYDMIFNGITGSDKSVLIPILTAFIRAALEADENGYSEVSGEYCNLKKELISYAIDVSKVKAIAINGKLPGLFMRYNTRL